MTFQPLRPQSQAPSSGAGLSGGIVASTYSGNSSGPSGSTANQGAYSSFSGIT
ncbi:hypothetical protein ABU162_25220 [Paenibacillus thiaminolyticus]|uniref:hypothetical protein n=1 Tax=Paenibacillus thiaminolyticus TaxID=49283 RepID=UPI0035A736A1